MADPGRLERPACGFEVRRSIQLSYGSGSLGVSDGIRTPDRWSHNPELYRLSYAHQEKLLRYSGIFTAALQGASRARDTKESQWLSGFVRDRLTGPEDKVGYG